MYLIYEAYLAADKPRPLPSVFCSPLSVLQQEVDLIHPFIAV